MFLKILNIIKLIFSYFLSIVSGRAVHWGLPLGIAFEPTNSCNLKCKECPTGLNILTRPKGKINFELYKNTLDRIAPVLTTIIFYFQGEAYLNHDIYKLIKYASDKKVYSILSTNAHSLTFENAVKTILAAWRCFARVVWKINLQFIDAAGCTERIVGRVEILILTEFDRIFRRHGLNRADAGTGG